MPRLIDHAARDQEIGEAALRVLARDGLAAVSVRRVAEEAGLATASLRRAFPTQDALREWCFIVIRDRVAARISGLAGAGPEFVLDLLAQLLPLDEERRVELVAQLQLATLSLTEPQLRAASADLTRGVRAVCGAAVDELARAGHVRHGADRELAVDGLHAMLDGLAIQALFDPVIYTPEVTTSRLRRLLATVTEK